MRLAISDAAEQLTSVLAEDLNLLTKTAKITLGDSRLIAETMLTIVCSCGMEMLVHPEAKPKDVAGRAISKLNLLLLGALAREQSMEQTKQGDAHE